MKRLVISTSSSGLENMDIRHDIELIRLHIYLNNVEFIDGRNINVKGLQRMMMDIVRTPVHTSPAPAEEVRALFHKLVDEGYEELFINVLSKSLSKSHEIITQVARDFENQLNIYIYDTYELNACEAFLALEAEHLLKQGTPMPEIAKRLDTLRASHRMLVAVEDLSYLIKNKKLSGVAGFIANLLKIKPVLHMTDDGRMVPINKIRKIDQAIKYTVDTLAGEVSRRDSFSYMLTTGREDLDEQMRAEIKRRIGIDDIVAFPISAIALANIGPTSVGLCTFTGETPYAARYFKHLMHQE